MACEPIEFEDGKELEVLFEDSCSAYLINMGFFFFYYSLDSCWAFDIIILNVDDMMNCEISFTGHK